MKIIGLIILRIVLLTRLLFTFVNEFNVFIQGKKGSIHGNDTVNKKMPTFTYCSRQLHWFINIFTTFNDEFGAVMQLKNF